MNDEADEILVRDPEDKSEFRRTIKIIIEVFGKFGILGWLVFGFTLINSYLGFINAWTYTILMFTVVVLFLINLIVVSKELFDMRKRRK